MTYRGLELEVYAALRRCVWQKCHKRKIIVLGAQTTCSECSSIPPEAFGTVENALNVRAERRVEKTTFRLIQDRIRSYTVTAVYDVLWVDGVITDDTPVIIHSISAVSAD